MHPQRFSANHDQVVLRAWQDQLTEATPSSNLKQTLVQRERELLPRFADHYQKLKALPRRTRRRLQREWKRSLAGLALLLALGQAPALAATINVGPGCSLINAIRSANTNSAVGGCTAGSGAADTILLPTDSTQRLSTALNTRYGPTGLPVITSTITIEGLVRGAAIQRDRGAPEFRILTVSGSGDLTLDRTRVSGGKLTISGDRLRDAGGGILNYGTLKLSYSTISGNLAFRGGGLANRGITAIITNSTISGNSTSGNRARGGGVHNRGPMTITNSTISGNSTSGRFSGGGGVFNDSGNLEVTFSTLTGNSTSASDSPGGGVFNYDGTLTLVGTLVSGNTASAGAEIYSRPSNPVVTNAYAYNLFGRAGLTTVQALANVTPGMSDITATDDDNTRTELVRILDATLRFNGGPTRTHCINAADAFSYCMPDSSFRSPAVGAFYDEMHCPPRDQRGARRNDFNYCNIGAYQATNYGQIPLCRGSGVTRVGTSSGEPLGGTGRADIMNALAGADSVSGLVGGDDACGGPGNDTVRGGPGDDRLHGDSFPIDEMDGPSIPGPPGNDVLDGGPGFDVCFGGQGIDRFLRCERTPDRAPRELSRP